MLELAKLVAVSMAGAFVVRSLVEFLVGWAVDSFVKLAWLKKFLPLVAFVGGLGFAFFYQLDFFAWMLEGPVTQVGVFLTGSLIGQGAEVVHKFVFEYLLRDWLASQQAKAHGWVK